MTLGDISLLIFIIIIGCLLFFLRGFQDNRVLEPEKTSLVPVVIGDNHQSQHRRVRIILPTGGAGLIQDAKIYQALIPNAYIVQVERNSPDTHPEMYVKVDVNLYLESIHTYNLFPADERWLMVNQEYFSLCYAEMVDVLIAKSHYAERLLLDYVKKMGLATRVVYLGHTSLPPDCNDREKDDTKDWHLAVHFAGKSRQKGTNQIIKLWQKNGGFRHLAPDTRLVITCRDTCLAKISDEITNLMHDGHGWHDPKTGLSLYPYLDEVDLNNLRRKAGLFLCPSVVEGYGHYINEGTAHGAVVITSDFPPMNELVPTNPLLVKPSLILESWQVIEPFGFLEPYLIGKHLPTSEACLADPSHLEEILDEYFRLPDEIKEILANNNYRHYNERQEEFKKLLTKFLSYQK